jgi:outer membrane protein assembly factor BamB
MPIPPLFRRLLSCACALSVATLMLSLASPATADWRQFHAGPSRLGVTTAGNLSPSNVNRLKVMWSSSTGSSAEGINSSPAVANGRVFVGSDSGRLYAFGTGGATLWSASIGGGAVRSSPAVDGSLVVVGSDHGYIQARSVWNGSLKWSHKVGGSVTSPPLIADGRVYVGTRGGMFFAFNQYTGKQVWKQQTWSVWDAAAYRNGVVYVGSDQSRVWAFDSDTGHKRWVTTVYGRVRSTPAVTDHRVYVGTDKGRVIALDRGTGHQIWSSAAVSPGNGYVRCAPAVANGLVVVSVGLTTTPMDGKLRAFHTTGGGLAWTGEMADYSTSSPAFVHGMFIAGSFDHRLYAFGADHGAELWTSGWKFQNGFFNRGISGSPAISGDKIYIGVRDGRLYALGLP